MLTLLFGVATRVPELYETSTLYENPAVYSVVMSDQEESDAPRIQATLRDGDGKISLEEFEKNMPMPLREKLDEALAGGWQFDEEKWKESLARHADDVFDPAKV